MEKLFNLDGGSYYIMLGLHFAGMYNGALMAGRKRPTFLIPVVIVLTWPVYFIWLVLGVIVDPFGRG